MPVIVTTPYYVGSVGSELFRDNFTDSNGTELISHTPDINSFAPTSWQPIAGGTYASSNSHGIIQNNTLTITANTKGYYVDTSLTQLEISVDWNTVVGESNRNSVLLRCNSAGSSFMYLNVRVNDGDITLRDNTGAGTTIPYAWVAGNTYNLKIVDTGSNITVFVDDVEIINENTAYSFGNTYVGLVRNSGSSLTSFDNFIINSVA